MRVNCDVCKAPIREARMDKEPNGDLVLTVICHGEEDSMVFPADWMQNNPDFMYLIMNNMVAGKAFVRKPSSV